MLEGSARLTVRLADQRSTPLYCPEPEKNVAMFQDDTMDSGPHYGAGPKTLAEGSGSSSGSVETLADSPDGGERDDRESAPLETIAATVVESSPFKAEQASEETVATMDSPRQPGLVTALQDTAAFTLPGRAAARSAAAGETHAATLEALMPSQHSNMTTDFGGDSRPSPEKTLADNVPGGKPGGPSEPPDYEVLGELGRGGMGVVYKARDRRLNRLVALKMIRGTNADEVQIARFKIEAEAVAALKHPNILQIYDIGEHNGSPFVALELLEGGSLLGKLMGTVLPPKQAAGWMVPLVMAMEAAHQAGIVHRDLKSANILFSGDGIPKITDFGLAKRLEADEGQTHTGQVMGTPSYMAPEQARGDTKLAGPPADIYALGAILYEMLTGRPPFKGISAARHHEAGPRARPALPVADPVPRAARPGNDLHEVLAERSAQALCHRQGAGRRPEPLSAW